MANQENINRQPEEGSSNQTVSNGKRKRPTNESSEQQAFRASLLQVALWKFLGKIFGNRTLTESRCLKWGDIFLLTDYKAGQERLGLKGAHSRGEAENEALQTATVKLYKCFQCHRPYEMNQPQSSFYLAVKNKIKDGDPVWYMKKAQAVNKIGKVPKSKGGSKNKRQRLS